MGGRGASSGAGRGKSGGGGSLYNGLRVEGKASNQQRADMIVKGMKDVLNDFGFADELTGVVFNEKGVLMGGEAQASMNGFGQLTISNKYLREPIKSSSGFLVSDTDIGTGTHEAGHAVVNSLLKHSVKINPDEPNKTDARARLEIATARKTGKLEKEIIKEAKKRYGSNPAISRYGSKNVIEKVAEAVSDVYTNKSKANPYSKTIVEVMKDIKKGKFNPTITVTKRQMGI